MILVVAIVAGYFTGQFLAKWKKMIWLTPALNYLWLVPVFFLPQLLSFYLPGVRNQLANSLVSVFLVISLLGLLTFCLLNRKLPGMPALSIGLLLNLVAITANGGFMPLSTQTAKDLFPTQALSSLEIGSRIGVSKDVLLPPEKIVFPLLVDRFMPPDWSPYQFAFSLGDVFIGIGAFFLLAFSTQSVSISQER